MLREVVDEEVATVLDGGPAPEVRGSPRCRDWSAGTRTGPPSTSAAQRECEHVGHRAAQPTDRPPEAGPHPASTPDMSSSAGCSRCCPGRPREDLTQRPVLDPGATAAGLSRTCVGTATVRPTAARAWCARSPPVPPPPPVDAGEDSQRLAQPVVLPARAATGPPLDGHTSRPSASGLQRAVEVGSGLGQVAA